MTYDEFVKYMQYIAMYETIYTDSDGREILVIRLLDAYSLMNDIQKLEKQNETTSR